jgi:hypothetical protein
LGDADTFKGPIKDFFPFQPFRSDDFPAQFYTFVTEFRLRMPLFSKMGRKQAFLFWGRGGGFSSAS